MDVMSMWKIDVRVVDARITDMSICFDVEPDSGSSVKNLLKTEQDLETRLGAYIEIVSGDRPNLFTIMVLPEEQPLVRLADLLAKDAFKYATSKLTVAVGMNYKGEPVMIDIEALPHMLIAGTTGSGKTVFLDDIIMSLLYKASPEDVRMILIDPKEVDLSYYNGVPHLLSPVVYEKEQIIGTFLWLEDEMLRRYELMAQSNTKMIQTYNFKNPTNKLYRIVVVIDEYSELMKDYKKEVEEMIDRISRLGRAAGVHLILATQRPTREILTPSIKANLPCRASFTVVDSRESTAIIDRGGAQRLIGNGDMIFSLSSSTGIEHLQAPLVTDKEIKRVVSFLQKNNQS